MRLCALWILNNSLWSVQLQAFNDLFQFNNWLLSFLVEAECFLKETQYLKWMKAQNFLRLREIEPMDDIFIFQAFFQESATERAGIKNR